jgi:MFS family permease
MPGHWAMNVLRYSVCSEQSKRLDLGLGAPIDIKMNYEAGAPRRLEDMPWPSLLVAWWMVGVLSLTALVSYTDRLILSVLVDQIRGDLALSDSMLGFLQGPAFTLVYVVAALGFGRLVDRHRRKPVLIGGVLLWSAAGVLCGLARNSETLFAGRMLLGVGEAVLLPTAFSMIADVLPSERRGIAVGTLILGTVVGGPLGITIGGLLLSAATRGAFATWPLLGALAPWRIVLVSVGLAGLISPILLLTVGEPLRRQSADVSKRGAAGYIISRSRDLLPLYGAMAFLSIGDYGLVSWVPTALSRHFGWPSDRVGVAFGLVTAAAGAAGSVCGGWISDFGARRGGLRGRLVISVVAAVIAMLGAAAIALGSAEFAVAGLGIWILASTVGSIGAFCAIQELVPSQFRGTSIALLTFTNTLIGLGAGPTLVALTTDHVYGAATAVDRAISTVAVPAATCAGVLLVLAKFRATAHRRYPAT